MHDRPTDASFHLPAATGQVEVIGENRQVAASAGQWADHFAPYQVHLYRLRRP
jgi:hypothetical protein